MQTNKQLQNTHEKLCARARSASIVFFLSTGVWCGQTFDPTILLQNNLIESFSFYSFLRFLLNISLASLYLFYSFFAFYPYCSFSLPPSLFLSRSVAFSHQCRSRRFFFSVSWRSSRVSILFIIHPNRSIPQFHLLLYFSVSYPILGEHINIAAFQP